MKKKLFKIIIFLFLILFVYCKKRENNFDKVEMLCIRDVDTLHIRIDNNSSDTIYIPGLFTGTFYEDGDTIFLETLDKAKYNSTIYYRYSNVLDFPFYVTKKINKIDPDTSITIKSQVYFYNQFRVRPFINIGPNKSFKTSILFNVPQRANCIQAVYYNRSFLKSLGVDSLNYSLSDFLKFDSTYSHYITSSILNRYYSN